MTALSTMRESHYKRQKGGGLTFKHSKKVRIVVPQHWHFAVWQPILGGNDRCAKSYKEVEKK